MRQLKVNSIEWLMWFLVAGTGDAQTLCQLITNEYKHQHSALAQKGWLS